MESQARGVPEVDVSQAIAERRSIRKFKDKPVPREVIEKLLGEAIKAPSGCNRQPWRFVVLEGAARDKVADLVAHGSQRLAGVKLPPDAGCLATARVMAEAPVIIMVYDPYWRPYDTIEGEPPKLDGWPVSRDPDVVDIQSVGAAIQNLLLSAQAMGLGTLWIGDTFFARDEIDAWLGRRDGMVAAVAVGYPDQSPGARPRKPVRDVTEWRDKA